MRKLALATVLSGCLWAALVQAQGIPVIDSANLTQTVVSAVEAVTQTANQIQQYQTQLQQYNTELSQLQNMQLNTESLARASQIFTQATSTMQRLQSLSNTLTQQKDSLGGLDQLLGLFRDQNSYACLGTGCPPTDYEGQLQRDRSQSAAVKAANDAVLRGNDQQAAGITADAAQLEQLQDSVRNAQGQLAAAQANGQLAAAQGSQLLQIRSLLASQANAAALSEQRRLDRESRENEAAAALRSGSFAPSSPQSWSVRP
jgi:type IV secretion system protein TrbJ